MSNTIILTKLRPQLKTTYDAKRLLKILEHLQESLFKNTATFEEVFNHDISFPLNEILRDLFEQHTIKINDQTNMQGFLTQLITTIKNLPTLDLTLSIAPHGQLLDKLNAWLTYNAPKPMLLAITVEPQLIGGIKIGIDGKYYDYSLQSKFKELNPEEILGSIK
jgi:F0F1-type ATP synthase delta subunit